MSETTTAPVQVTSPIAYRRPAQFVNAAPWVAVGSFPTPRSQSMADSQRQGVDAEFAAYMDSAQHWIDMGLHGDIHSDGRGGAWVSVNQTFATREEADAFVAQFPKSAKWGVCSFSGRGWTQFSVKTRFNLTANGVTGAKNETAIKRFRALEKKLAKLGLLDQVIWFSDAGNAMTREALEPLLAL